MPISYSQGLADLNFINDFCHQNLIDYEVNSTTGKLLSRDGRLVTTNMSQRLQTESIFNYICTITKLQLHQTVPVCVFWVPRSW